MSAELRDRIARVLDAQGIGDGYYETPVPGLILMRSAGQLPPFHMLYRPTLCVVAQGAKEVMVAERRVRYGDGQTLVVTIEAPVLSELVQASAGAPYLGAILALDPDILLDVAGRLEASTVGGAPRFGMEVHDLDAQITAALVRLLDLVADPNAVAILYPTVLREIAYWLARGPAAALISQMVVPQGEPQRIARAMTYLRDHFDETVSVRDLAAAAGMSPSTFHHHFKSLTSMSPLQYQKHLRLLEARRRMLNGGEQAGHAAAAVGYESVSHFSREYARMFGSPPRREIRRAGAGRVPPGRAETPSLESAGAP